MYFFVMRMYEIGASRACFFFFQAGMFLCSSLYITVFEILYLCFSNIRTNFHILCCIFFRYVLLSATREIVFINICVNRYTVYTKQEVIMGRKYSDINMRVQKTNRFISCGIVLVDTIYIMSILARTAPVAANMPALKLAAVIYIGLSGIINLALSYSRMQPGKTTYVIVVNLLLGYTLCDILSTEIFAPYIVFAAISAFTFYYNKKLIRIPAVLAFLIGIVTKIIDLASLYSTDGSRISVIIGIVFMFAFMMTMFVISLMSDMYNADIFGTLEDQKQAQQETVNNVSAILTDVQSETVSINSQLHDLEESSGRIVEAIEHVNEGMNSTVEAIARQGEITDSIHTLVNKTSSNVTRIEEISTNVQEAVHQGNLSADNLNNLSSEINKTNETVTASMEALKARAQAMQGVIDEIVNISSQTTLLALNASIEAARAGEAGRGFSVVADEIRNLSDQTKQSTENIRAMIAELETEAQNASDVVASSVDAVAHQSEYVDAINDDFGSIDSRMSDLQNSIRDISDTVAQLVESNNVISDSISQLSAVSEEVTAENSQVLSDAVRNRESVDAARKSVENVHAIANRVTA